jgi:hypothetical protein
MSLLSASLSFFHCLGRDRPNCSIITIGDPDSGIDLPPEGQTLKECPRRVHALRRFLSQICVLVNSKSH